MTIGYDDVGRGTALVLIHGHPFDRSMWHPQVERFANEGFRVIVPDLRGYGESETDDDITRLDVFVDDVAQLLDRLGIDTFVLGGLSMGGQIAMEFYRLHPKRIRGLVLADTTHSAETPGGRVERREMADRLLHEGMEPYTDEALALMVAPRNLEAMPVVAGHVRDMMCRTSPRGAAAALRGRAERPDYAAVLAQVEVPTLVVVGRDDTFTPVGDAEAMHALVPDATLAVIDRAAHLPNLERPEDFNAALAAFLYGLGAGS